LNDAREVAMNDAIGAAPHPTLRPVTPADEPFLFHLYATTRADEMAAWGLPEAQRESILKLQFVAQQRDYTFRFPAADHQLVLLDDTPIGRLWVARDETATHLLDVALLPAYRGRGLGTYLLQRLLAEAAERRRPFRLMVLKANAAALRLYQRLGLAITADAEPYWLLERRAAP
jgi:ribosomal protein S18 acetylase RimI-like enzyme